MRSVLLRRNLMLSFIADCCVIQGLLWRRVDSAAREAFKAANLGFYAAMIGVEIPFSTGYNLGEECAGKLHGYGVAKCTEGSDKGCVYEGQFSNGNVSGYGVFRWPDGEEYAGQWSAGHKHGLGSRRHPDGFLFRGHWKDGKQHGRGIETCPDGDVDEGEWADGKFVPECQVL
eukprot:GHVU01197264.1.p1 GENE.GHVU01197264.1~~GHVU01197264.1.p1  ORF type:complete len:173 (-),score=9.02 GHVU01197264.1:27-545(-)